MQVNPERPAQAAHGSQMYNELRMELYTELQLADGVLAPAECDLVAVASRAFAQVLNKGWATGWLNRAGDVEECGLCIRLVDLREGQQLNNTWRGKSTATNVLSFGADIVAGTQAPLGDLVFCSGVIEREAREQNKTLADHYTHLTLHGMLHLLGYDHADETEAEEMEAMEVAVLRSLGVPNPYEAGGDE